MVPKEAAKVNQKGNFVSELHRSFEGFLARNNFLYVYSKIVRGATAPCKFCLASRLGLTPEEKV